MSDLNKVVSVLLILVSFTACILSTASGASDKNYNSSSIKDLVAFVDEARSYAIANGNEKAFLEFDNRSGIFVRGDLYIYAYGFNGTNLAHPFRPEFIGNDKSNLTDSNGVAYIRDLIDNARRDGFTYFIFPNPAHDNRNELKLGYVNQVADSWWLGSGIYLSSAPAFFSDESRRNLVSFVDGAFNYTIKNGKARALEEFNNSTGPFVKGNKYIFAYDFNGTVLALPLQPQLIGENRIDAVDTNGVKYIKNAIDQAKRGEGSVYYFYPDPDKNMTVGLKLSYIKKVDDTWWLGSGVYAGYGVEPR